MKIAIGGDHAGYQYKEVIQKQLIAQGHDVSDFGPHGEDSVDYPDFAHPVANAVETNVAEMGILICGTGNGVAITANKHQSIRAGLCWNEEIGALVRQHNDANICCIPARFVNVELALKIVDTFVKTSFEGGRHDRRVNKICI